MENVNFDWVSVLDYEEMRKVRRKHWTYVIWFPDGWDIKDEKQRHDFLSGIAKNLSDMVIPSLISPVHDSDLKEDGKPAKPHVHVISLWEQPTRYGLVLNTLKNGCQFQDLNYIQPVVNLRAMMRYLVHLDNPEKIAYDPMDVIQVAGAQYVLEEETASEKVTTAILDLHIYTLTALLSHFSPSPSCCKWIMSNVGLCKELVREQRDMSKRHYEQVRSMSES